MTTQVLHIGKTGGAALKLTLRPFCMSHDIRLAGHDCTLPDVSSFVIFNVRDPISRFVSSFNSRLRKGRPRNYNEWRPEETEAFAQFSTPNDLGEALSSNREHVRDAASAAMNSIYHIKHKFSKWLISEAYLRSREQDIRWICDQASLDEDFEHIKRLLGLPEDLLLPADPIQAHRTPEGFSRNLSDVARANLTRWYSDDIDLYDCCLEMRQRLVERQRQ